MSGHNVGLGRKTIGKYKDVRLTYHSFVAGNLQSKNVKKATVNFFRNRSKKIVKILGQTNFRKRDKKNIFQNLNAKILFEFFLIRILIV